MFRFRPNIVAFVWRYLENAYFARTTGGKRVKPFLPSLYLTNECNYRCVYCDDGTGRSYPSNTRAQQLNTHDVKRVLDIMRRVSPGINITGGEPLLRPDIDEIFAHIHKLDFPLVALNTNGALLHQHLQLLPHVGYLIVSLDSLDEARFSTLGGVTRSQGGSLVQRNLGLATERRQQERLAFQVVINTVILPESIDDAWDVWQYCVDRDYFWSPMPHVRGPYPNPGLVDNPRWRELIDEVIRAKRGRGRIFGCMASLRAIRDFARYECYPTTRPMIHPDGSLSYPCGPKGTVAGNILDIGDYEEAISAGERLHGPIPTCDARCHVGCFLEGSLNIAHPVEALRFEVPLLLGAHRCVPPSRPPRQPTCALPSRAAIAKLPVLAPDRVRGLRASGRLQNDFSSSIRVTEGTETASCGSRCLDCRQPSTAPARLAVLGDE